MTNHKSRIWRDIDKHPLPEKTKFDLKLACGKILLDCITFNGGLIYHNRGAMVDLKLEQHKPTQWRDAK